MEISDWLCDHLSAKDSVRLRHPEPGIFCDRYLLSRVASSSPLYECQKNRRKRGVRSGEPLARAQKEADFAQQRRHVKRLGKVEIGA